MGSRTTQAKQPPKTSSRYSRFNTFASKNKALFTILSILLVVSVFVGISKYGAYLNKFSDKDYAAIEKAAAGVMTGVGAQDLQKHESCHYRAPEKYSSVRLYCSVQVVAYLPYGDDQQAVSVAKSIERERVGV